MSSINGKYENTLVIVSIKKEVPVYTVGIILNYRHGAHYTKSVTGFSAIHSSIQSHAHKSFTQTFTHSSLTRFSWLALKKSFKKQKQNLPPSTFDQPVKTVTKLFIHTGRGSALHFCVE